MIFVASTMVFDTEKPCSEMDAVGEQMVTGERVRRFLCGGEVYIFECAEYRSNLSTRRQLKSLL